MKARNPDNFDMAVKCDDAGRLVVAPETAVDMPLGLGGGTAPIAPVALTAETGISVPTGKTYVFQAWLVDNPGSTVHLRVDDATGQGATSLSTTQRWLVNGAKVAVPGPCYVYPKLFDLDGTAATATANDLLLISAL